VLVGEKVAEEKKWRLRKRGGKEKLEGAKPSKREGAPSAAIRMELWLLAIQGHTPRRRLGDDVVATMMSSPSEAEPGSSNPAVRGGAICPGERVD